MPFRTSRSSLSFLVCCWKWAGPNWANCSSLSSRCRSRRARSSRRPNSTNLRTVCCHLNELLELVALLCSRCASGLVLGREHRVHEQVGHRGHGRAVRPAVAESVALHGPRALLERRRLEGGPSPTSAFLLLLPVHHVRSVRRFLRRRLPPPPLEPVALQAVWLKQNADGFAAKVEKCKAKCY